MAVNVAMRDCETTFLDKAGSLMADSASTARHRQTGLTDILYQCDGDYCMADAPSRRDTVGAEGWSAGGRYPSDECGLTVL